MYGWVGLSGASLLDYIFQTMVSETSHPKENRFALHCEEKLHLSEKHPLWELLSF